MSIEEQKLIKSRINRLKKSITTSEVSTKLVESKSQSYIKKIPHPFEKTKRSISIQKLRQKLDYTMKNTNNSFTSFKKLINNPLHLKMISSFMAKRDNAFNEPKRRNINKNLSIYQIRENIISKYVNGISKYDLGQEKKNMHRFIEEMDVYNKQLKEKEFNNSRFFYELKGGSSIGLFDQEAYKSKTKINNNYQIYTKDKIEKRSKLLSTSLDNINAKKYEPMSLEEKEKNLANLNYFNSNNLDRIIKVFTIRKYLYDIPEDYLLDHNVSKLKEFMCGLNSQHSINMKNCKTFKLKYNFKNNTIKKFNGVAGKYFGLPV